MTAIYFNSLSDSFHDAVQAAARLWSGQTDAAFTRIADVIESGGWNGRPIRQWYDLRDLAPEWHQDAELQHAICLDDYESMSAEFFDFGTADDRHFARGV